MAFSFSDCPKLSDYIQRYQVDGLMWKAEQLLAGVENPSVKNDRCREIAKTIAAIPEESKIMRDEYIKRIARAYNLNKRSLEQFVTDQGDINNRKKDIAGDQDPSTIPSWVDKKTLYETGFVQLSAHIKGFKAGIYFLNSGMLYRVTNFTIKPLYHIYEQSNNRRLVEVNNSMRSTVVELPSQAMTNKMMFENELINKGYFHCEYGFTQKEFKHLTGWLGSEMPLAFELKTLGWQPEGFFAYSNAIWHQGNLLMYDDLGMIKVEDKHYISIGNSRIHHDERQTDNPYENDLYLKWVNPKDKLTFSQWASLFHTTYADNAANGIAFVFLTVFKDIVTRVAKMPMLYCYGPKGSGKSQMAESITWLFFSGKNGEGDLIKGYNLNPGQGTPFSFFNRVERFRNCPILMNEFDENNIEDWKFGTFKAAYDGEGREVGDGDTGRKRKTKIQKVQGTIILVGQYLSIRDDGSVLSRSVSCPFNLERLSNLTEEQMKAHEALKHAEQSGLSALIVDLLTFRPEVQKRFANEFTTVQGRLTQETRAEGQRIEARLINNYSLVITATNLIQQLGIALPYTAEEFYQTTKSRVMDHSKMLKDNNSIHQFWKGVEFLFDTGIVANGRDLKIGNELSILIKAGDSNVNHTFTTATEVLYVRFSNLYSLYSKYYRERTGKQAPGEETLLMYMKEQSYYLGLVGAVAFNDKRTSAYAFNYTKMQDLGIVLQKDS